MAKRGGFPGGMPGNMNNLMKQAQRMQRQMEEQQVELENKEFSATAGGGVVEVRCLRLPLEAEWHGANILIISLTISKLHRIILSGMGLKACSQWLKKLPR